MIIKKRALEQFSRQFVKMETSYFCNWSGSNGISGYIFEVEKPSTTWGFWFAQLGPTIVYIFTFCLEGLVFVPQPCMVHLLSSHRLRPRLFTLSPGGGGRPAEDASLHGLAPLFLHPHWRPGRLPGGELAYAPFSLSTTSPLPLHFENPSPPLELHNLIDLKSGVLGPCLNRIHVSCV